MYLEDKIGNLEIRAVSVDYDTRWRIGVFREMPDGSRQILQLEAKWVPWERGTIHDATIEVWAQQRDQLVQQLGQLAIKHGFLPANDRVAGELDAKREHVTDLRNILDQLLAFKPRL